MKKIILFYSIIFFIVLVVCFFVGEALVAGLKPQKVLYPRWEATPEYRSLPYPNVRMVETVPGKWRFTYTINEHRHRGEAVPIQESYEKKNIVVLGDSNAFGHGVNDGDEFPAVLDKLLEEKYDVINLSCGGWGLTQQIRRFYDLGIRYKPSLVILQFAANDPNDNIQSAVTKVRDGEFVFQNIRPKRSLLNRYFSKSIIQYSQIYSLVRHSLFPYIRRLEVQKGGGEVLGKKKAPDEEPTITHIESFYNELLTYFAQDLNRRNISLLFMPLENHLRTFPFIAEKVEELDREEDFHFIDVKPWMEGRGNLASPEGHQWGRNAQAIVGRQLAKYISTIETY